MKKAERRPSVDRDKPHKRKHHKKDGAGTPVKEVTEKASKVKDGKESKKDLKPEEDFLEALEGLISPENPNKKYECVEKLGAG